MLPPSFRPCCLQLCGFELLTRLAYSWEATAALLIHPSPWQWLVSFASAMVTVRRRSSSRQTGSSLVHGPPWWWRPRRRRSLGRMEEDD